LLAWAERAPAWAYLRGAQRLQRTSCILNGVIDARALSRQSRVAGVTHINSISQCTGLAEAREAARVHPSPCARGCVQSHLGRLWRQSLAAHRRNWGSGLNQSQTPASVGPSRSLAYCQPSTRIHRSRSLCLLPWGSPRCLPAGGHWARIPRGNELDGLWGVAPALPSGRKSRGH